MTWARVGVARSRLPKLWCKSQLEAGEALKYSTRQEPDVSDKSVETFVWRFKLFIQLLAECHVGEHSTELRRVLKSTRFLQLSNHTDFGIFTDRSIVHQSLGQLLRVNLLKNVLVLDEFEHRHLRVDQSGPPAFIQCVGARPVKRRWNERTFRGDEEQWRLYSGV